MRTKPRTRYQRETAACEVFGAIRHQIKTKGVLSHSPVILELCVAGEILLSAPGDYLATQWERIDRLIDGANGVPHETFTCPAHEAHVKQLRDKNPAAVVLGRLGGLKGGCARAKALSPQRRSYIAKEAALKRWHGDKKK